MSEQNSHQCEGLDYHPIHGTLHCQHEATVKVGSRWYCWLHEEAHGRQLEDEDLTDDDLKRVDNMRRWYGALGFPGEFGEASEA